MEGESPGPGHGPAGEAREQEVSGSVLRMWREAQRWEPWHGRSVWGLFVFQVPLRPGSDEIK